MKTRTELKEERREELQRLDVTRLGAICPRDQWAKGMIAGILNVEFPDLIPPPSHQPSTREQPSSYSEPDSLTKV